jgi:hypothetical protein
MAKMRHSRYSIDFDFSGHFDLINRKGQSRPKYIPSFEDLEPVVLLNYVFDEL